MFVNIRFNVNYVVISVSMYFPFDSFLRKDSKL
jgi:hypothetical protein